MTNQKVTFITNSTFYMVKIRSALDVVTVRYSEHSLKGLMKTLNKEHNNEYLSFHFEVSLDHLEKLSDENKQNLSRWIENGEIAVTLK